MFSRLRQWARTIKREAHALYIAARHPRTPWYAKALALVIAAYALSPIDLIPDFIPILGFLDDVILLPLAIAGVLKLVPADVMSESRAAAAAAAATASQPRCLSGYRADLGSGYRANRMACLPLFRAVLVGGPRHVRARPSPHISRRARSTTLSLLYSSCGTGLDSSIGSSASSQPSVPSGYHATRVYPIARIRFAAFHDIQQSRRQ